MNDYLILGAGILLAGAGGEFFLRGLLGLAGWLRISPGIIGATVAAFATSSPELSVAISSASAGHPEISLGDALGSNVVNIAFIMGLALVIAGISCPRDSVRRDFPGALLVPLIVGSLAWDGRLSRGDGVLLLGIFGVWLAVMVRDACQQRGASEAKATRRPASIVLVASLLGLLGLFGGGRLIVLGAKGIALKFGVPEFIIGATVIAVGTSVPELATSVLAQIRGHSEIGLGTILGSNIFNGLFIVGLAATICPISTTGRELTITLAAGLVTTAMTFPARNGCIGRARGLFLLAAYGVYITALIRH